MPDGKYFPSGITSMKQVVYILFLVLSSTFCRAQNQTMLFEKIWGTDSAMYTSVIIYVDQQSNGDYFMIGGKSVGHWSAYVYYACRTDSTGVLLWEKTWGVPDSRCAFSKVIKSATGTYIAVGTSGPILGGISDIIVTNIDANGDIIFNRYYNFSYEDCGYDIISTYDGGYIIAGVKGTSPGNRHPGFIKIDADGNEIWRRTQSSLIDYAPFYLSQTTDSGFIVLGTTGGYNNCFYAQYDSLGMMQWIRYPFGFGDTIENTPGTIRANHDGTFDIIYSAYYPLQPEPITAILFRYNEDGDTLWRKNYYESVNSFFVRAEDTVMCCMMWGQSYGEMHENYEFVQKTNASGSSSHYLYSYFLTNDGGYIGCGRTSPSNGTYKFYVIKFSPDGRHQAVPFLSQIAIGPNPSFDGNINVSFDVQTDENIQVRVIGIDGRLVYYDEIFCPANSHTDLPIDILGTTTTAGVYILEVKTSTEFRREKLVVGRTNSN